mmetsp:Transcript_17421/g.27244  ORF Transcript_17421/g.27244 Transcript_17421/m.27244 type:complete len:149 (-) Transcript_17421:67-513(-)
MYKLQARERERESHREREREQRMLRIPMLASYKRLLIACNRSFGHDLAAFSAARLRIRDEYYKNAEETNEEALKEKIGIAYQTAEYLETYIVQAEHREGDNKEQFLKLKPNEAMRNNWEKEEQIYIEQPPPPRKRRERKKKRSKRRVK